MSILIIDKSATLKVVRGGGLTINEPDLAIAKVVSGAICKDWLQITPRQEQSRQAGYYSVRPLNA